MMRVSNNVEKEPANSKIGLMDLPEELIDHIAKCATLQTLKNLSRTSKAMFRITENHIALQCVITPSRSEQEKHMCDLMELKRKYFNLRIEESFNISMIQDIPNIIPKNVFTGTKVQAGKLNHFCETNDFVEKVFINFDGWENPDIEIQIPEFPRAITVIYSCTGQNLDPILFIERFPNTLNIETNPCEFAHENWEEFGKKNNIQKLTISEIKLTNTEILFKYFTKLRSVDIIRCKTTEFDGRFLQYLDTLCFYEMEISKHMLTNLAKFSKLSALKFVSCNFDKQFSSSDFTFLGSIQRLRIRSDLLEKIGLHLKKVESLEVEFDGNFNPPVVTLPRLKHFAIIGDTFDKKHSTNLKNIKAPNLKFLDLPDIFDWVPNCQSLRIREPIENIIKRSRNVFAEGSNYIPKIFLNCKSIHCNQLFKILLNGRFQNTAFHIDFFPLLRKLYIEDIEKLSIAENLSNIQKEAEKLENIFVGLDNDRKVLKIEKENTELTFYERGPPRVTHEDLLYMDPTYEPNDCGLEDDPFEVDPYYEPNDCGLEDNPFEVDPYYEPNDCGLEDDPFGIDPYYDPYDFGPEDDPFELDPYYLTK